MITNNTKTKHNELTKIKQSIIKRLYKNGFVPKTFLSFNPHQPNCSEMYLGYHFRKCLKKYYSQPNVLGRDFNERLDEQYKLVIFFENGQDRDTEKHPHLHILTELEGSKALNLYCFLVYSLQNRYPCMTGQLINIEDTPQDLLNVWSYCDKEQKEFERGQSKYGNVILTHADLQKKIFYKDPREKLSCIEEWFRSPPSSSM